MEHVDGRDLFDYFSQEKIAEKPYKMQLTRDLARELIYALEEFSAHAIIHKDLKLENIVFDERVRKQEGPVLHCNILLYSYSHR